MILTLRALPSTQIQKVQVAPVQYLVSGCTPGSDRSQGCKSRRPDDYNDVRKASNTPLVLFSETRRKQPSKTEKTSIVTPFSVPLRIPQVVIVCPKREETALSPFLWSKRVTDGRKCPKNGTQKPDHLIRTGSYDPVGGIDTRPWQNLRPRRPPLPPCRRWKSFHHRAEMLVDWACPCRNERRPQHRWPERPR